MSDPYYRDKATKYAPKTAEEVAKAARDLSASGFSLSTVAAILKVDTDYLRLLIGERTAA
jgi:hypothetical protein